MVAAVVLAAGGSRRLGHPKQLLLHDGRSLVRRTVEAALAAGCAPVVVVLGAHPEAVRAALAGLDVAFSVNPRWRDGMASSIRCGVERLSAEEGVRAALLLVCDQPRLTAAVLGRLIAEFDGAAGRRVACRYADTVGVPALFERSLFGELLGLTGDRGAKALLQADPERLRVVPWPEGELDVDEPPQP